MVLSLALSLAAAILTGASALLFPSLPIRGRKIPVYPFIPFIGAILILSFGLAPYAVILSSNLAAYLTPFGALAGLMFLQKVREEGIPLTFLRFTREGLMVAVPALLAGLLALQLEAFLFV